jgi:hypothetical protein
MIAVPVVTPVTKPVDVPRATLVLPVLHTPPPVASVSVTAFPMHTVLLPVTGDGPAFTVIIFVAAQPVGSV